MLQSPYVANRESSPQPPRHGLSKPNVETSLQQDITITVGDIGYYLVGHREVNNSFNVPEDSPTGILTQNILTSTNTSSDLTLAIIYPTKPGETLTASSLRDFLTTRLQKDDIYQPAFCTNVIFYGSSKADLKIDLDVYTELSSWNTEHWLFVAKGCERPVPAGPYVFLRDKMYQPWRIYHDTHAAFMSTFRPGPNNSLLTLSPHLSGLNISIIVPPRSYFMPSPSQPLAGHRIAVKDNIDVAGHITSLNNISWMSSHPPASRTASCVQKLIDAGAVIVGKVKLQAMIMREEPLECVEFTAPFNPRGGGDQVPSGSSDGSAVAVAAYRWLDWSLGSDTNGSGRKPASLDGCFTIRPSTGIMDTEGVIGQFNLFDMPVFFSRNLTHFPTFIKTWYGSSPLLRSPSSPASIKILWPLDYLPTVNAAQTKLIDTFACGLEKAFGVERTEISLEEEWRKHCPDGVENGDLSAYLARTGSYPYFYDSYWDLEDFRKGYKERFGVPPKVHRAMLWQWEISKTITKTERDFFWRRSELYRHWLLESIFEKERKDQVTIMVFPIEEGKPNYRDEVPAPFQMLSGYNSLAMSPILRGPEVTAIVGEITYNSRTTEREEPMPVAASVLGAPGMDLVVTDLVLKGMKAAGLPVEVETGRSVYEGDEMS